MPGDRGARVDLRLHVNPLDVDVGLGRDDLGLSFVRLFIFGERGFRQGVDLRLGRVHLGVPLLLHDGQTGRVVLGQRFESLVVFLALRGFLLLLEGALDLQPGIGLRLCEVQRGLRGLAGVLGFLVVGGVANNAATLFI